MTHISTQKQNQPTALWWVGLCLLLFGFSQGWVVAMQVLYLQKSFGFSETNAISLAGSTNALYFMMPLVGGLLIDKFGKHRAISHGTVFMVIAMVLMGLHNQTCLIMSFAFYIVGGALVIPAYYCVLGGFYRKNDVRRESGFTLMYMIMNSGFFIANIVGAFLSAQTSYAATNLLFSIVVLVSLILYLGLSKTLKQANANHSGPKEQTNISLTLILILFILLGLCLTPIIYPILVNYMVILLIIGALFGGVYHWSTQKESQAKAKILLFYILCFISTCFWLFYFLEPTLLTEFSTRNLNLNFLSINFPPSSILSLDYLFVAVNGIIITRIWINLAQKNKDPSMPLKFTIAPLWVALGYCTLILGIYLYPHHMMNMTWMIIAYFLFTLGELFLAPIGFSMAGKLAPPEAEGFFMGVWQISIGIAAIGAALATNAANITAAGSLHHRNLEYLDTFLIFAGIGFGIFLFALVLLPWMKRLIK